MDYFPIPVFADAESSYRPKVCRHKLAARNLVIVTPDNLYQVLLREFRFKRWNTRVAGGATDLVMTEGSAREETFLVFADHFEKLELARLVSKIKETSAKSLIACIVDLREPTLVVLHGETNKETADRPIRIVNIGDLELILDDICGRAEAEATIPAVTGSQLQLLEAIAIGRSNNEIAEERSVTVKAVEGLVDRAMVRIGVAKAAGVRAKVVAAQRYLAELHRS